MSRALIKAAVIAAVVGVSNSAFAATATSSATKDSKALTSSPSTESGTNQAGRAVEIVILFRSDCAPCRHELDILPGIAAHYPDVTMTLLVLRDDGLLARKGEAFHPSNLRIHNAEGADIQTMARYGNERHALPFSAALDAKGRICGRHYGLLGLDTIGQWREAC
jgi:thiol-disulfide isomerase/thioredoxin